MECLNNYDIKELHKEEIEIYTRKLVDAFKVDCYDLYLEDNLNHYKKGNIFLGAKMISTDLLIGGICLERKPLYKNEIYIEGLFVDEEYRHQGVATNLLNYIADNKMDIFRRNKIELYLFCEETLKQFYEKERFYEEDCYVGDSQKVLRMKRNI